MADCCLSLIEASVFHQRQLQRVRMVLKRLPAQTTPSTEHRADALWKRVLAFEGASR
jgi:hypothetical protein